MNTGSTKKAEELNPGWILTADQMEVLRRKPYMYNATAGSVLELLFLQRFWTCLSQYIPLRITPCFLTCAGLAINIISSLVLLYFSPDATAEAPSWSFLLCALGVFLYQTLDALDGKQAIKVQDSQIEELYDHGCDAISTVFVTLAVSVAVQLGTCPPFMFMFFLTSVVAFFSTHWQDHVTHVMVFGRIDVSEGQWIMIVIHLLTAAFGQHIWKTEVFKGVELCHILSALTILSLGKAIIDNLKYILGSETPLHEFVNIPRKKGTQIWSPLIPISILTLLASRAYTAGLFSISPSIFIIAFGFAFAKLTMKLVVTNVTHADMDLWDTSLLAPLLLCLNSLLQLLPCYTAILCSLVYNIIDFARYFTYASWDMKTALDLWIFSLKYPVGHPKHRSGNLGFYMNGLNNNEVKASAKTSFKLVCTFQKC